MKLRTVASLFVLSIARVSHAEPDVTSVSLNYGTGTLTDNHGHVARATGFEWRNSNKERELGDGFTFSFDSDARFFSAEFSCDGLDWATIRYSTWLTPKTCRLDIHDGVHDYVMPWRGAVGLSRRGVGGTETQHSGVEVISGDWFTGCSSCKGAFVPSRG